MSAAITPLEDRELSAVSAGRGAQPSFVYVIQKGDTLSLIAQRFGTTVRVLRELNALPAADQLRPGMRLLVPQK